MHLVFPFLILSIATAVIVFVFACNTGEKPGKGHEPGKGDEVDETQFEYTPSHAGPTVKVFQIKKREREDIEAEHKKHRDAEGKEAGVTLPDLKWHIALARVAADHAVECPHVPIARQSYPVKASEFKLVGELRFTDYGGPNIRDALRYWMLGKKDYDWAKGECKSMDDGCKTYQQVVWGNTKHVGCARVDCMDKLTSASQFRMYCAYGPAGNVEGEKPYERKEN